MNKSYQGRVETASLEGNVNPRRNRHGEEKV
jgi:hypothetical protein